jgi:hypothetical protein
MDEHQPHARVVKSGFQDTENRGALGVALALMDGEAGRLVNDHHALVFIETIDHRSGRSRRQILPVGLEGNVKLDAVAGTEAIVRLGAAPVDAHAVFAENFPDVADRKPCFLGNSQALWPAGRGAKRFPAWFAIELTGKSLPSQAVNFGLFAIH